MASWSRLTYPRRLFLWLLGYSALLVGCFTVFQYHREKEFKASQINSQLQLINAYILTELDEGVDIRDIRLDDFRPFGNIRVSLVSDSGDLVYDNALQPEKRANHLDRVEIRDAVAYGEGYDVRRHSESTGGYYFYSATRGDNGYVVRTAVPYSVSLSTLLQADFGFLWIMGAVSVVMCVLGYFATRRVGDHIMRLNRFAESVESGARISDTEPFPHDELGEISNNIVRLYARLQQANADRDSEHRAALREQHEKERIKKQLTNNINHELKTPVASIKVCVETMLAHPGMNEEKRQQFLTRSLSSADRLARLLDDVSLVTRMDDGGAMIMKQRVDMAGIIDEVVADRRLVAAPKGFGIVNRVTGPVEMNGNKDLLAAIFNNLIDNAVAYSLGSIVEIGPATESGGMIELTLADNGTGVADEHLPRIFERFYRIDKGRSRAAGGTGLGLAIVKNAVMFHGGRIVARNRPEGGLAFTITFKKDLQADY